MKAPNTGLYPCTLTWIVYKHAAIGVGDTKRYTPAMKAIRLSLAAMLALVCVSALAQWQWLDRDGRKVFSDRAPPPEVPEKSILKRPGKPLQPQEPTTQTEEAAPSAPAQASAVPIPKKSALDIKLEEKKKQAEQAEAAKKKAEDDRIAQAKVENCERARKAKAALDSGIRMSTVNAKGEREIMDDAARAAESKRIQGIVVSDCK